MKCGTTTIHHILDQHPRVFIPYEELHFFDADDVLQHPDFNFFRDGRWTSQQLDADPGRFWAWYKNKFDGAKSAQLLGEDSTTYLASRLAHRRLAKQRVTPKIIACLRNPVDRAYSHYWHLVKTGRCGHSFEDLLRVAPAKLLTRSLYKSQLEHLLRYIPRERVHVMLLEDFVADKRNQVQQLVEFLGLSFDELPESSLETRSNPAALPKHVGLQLTFSRVATSTRFLRYSKKLPNQAPKPRWTSRALARVHRQINPIVERRPPSMLPATRERLESYFIRELAGLDDVVGRPVMQTWFPGRSVSV